MCASRPTQRPQAALARVEELEAKLAEQAVVLAGAQREAQQRSEALTRELAQKDEEVSCVTEQLQHAILQRLTEQKGAWQPTQRNKPRAGSR